MRNFVLWVNFKYKAKENKFIFISKKKMLINGEREIIRKYSIFNFMTRFNLKLVMYYV